MQRLPLANREEELSLFDAMIAGTTGERILLLEAGGAMGKTMLMAEFVRHCRSNEVACAPVDLKGPCGRSRPPRTVPGTGWGVRPVSLRRPSPCRSAP